MLDLYTMERTSPPTLDDECGTLTDIEDELEVLIRNADGG